MQAHLEKAKMGDSQEAFFARRKMADELSRLQHCSFFYRGKWHHCSCHECLPRHKDDD